jgi:hypothetical protein
VRGTLTAGSEPGLIPGCLKSVEAEAGSKVSGAHSLDEQRAAAFFLCGSLWSRVVWTARAPREGHETRSAGWWGLRPDRSCWARCIPVPSC